jgi:hypothetical protein
LQHKALDARVQRGLLVLGASATGASGTRRARRCGGDSPPREPHPDRPEPDRSSARCGAAWFATEERIK